MSTHSMIGHLQPSGTVRAIYCHSDGYPDHVGAILAKHYATQARAVALLDLGGLSTLEPQPAPEPGQPHRLGNAAPGVRVAYARDRGDTDTQATIYPGPVEFFADAVGPDGVGEFAYLLCPLSGWGVAKDTAPDLQAPLALVLAEATA